MNKKKTPEEKNQWLIKKNGINEEKIYNTTYKHGTVVIPTGVGKTGLIIESIVRYIRDDNPLNKRRIFVINGPYLSLLAQLFTDATVVISKVVPKDIRDKILFFKNSSDNANPYDDAMEVAEQDLRSFDKCKGEKGFGAFLDNADFKYAIIASCNKSLSKIDKQINKWKERGIETFIYLDEAHTLSVSKDTVFDSERTYVDFNKLTKADYVYGLTATPDPEVTKALNNGNNIEGNPDTFYIINEKAKYHIKENNIMEPYIETQLVTSTTYRLTADFCEKYMKYLKKENNKINHKVLLTVYSKDELKEIEKEIYAKGYKVFSTCSGSRDDEGLKIDCVKQSPSKMNIRTFCEAIDDYNGDCFVIHIKQMTAGIDIKSLTACIIYAYQHGDSDNYRQYIQIIGRVLRPAEGERGMVPSERTKTKGYVLFLIPETSERQNTVTNAMCDYYGVVGTFDFGTKSFHPWAKRKAAPLVDVYGGDEHINDDDNNDDPEFILNEMKVNLEKYVKRLASHLFIASEYYTPLLLAKQINDLKSMYNKQFEAFRSVGIHALIYDNDVDDILSVLLKKYNIPS